MIDITKLLPEPHTAGAYLDNAASTIPLPELTEILPTLCRIGFVNPSTTTTRSQVLKRAITKLSKQFIEATEMDGARLVWTAGGTEANNLALLGAAPANGSWIGREIVTSTVEHPSVEQPLRSLEAQGAMVRRIAVDSDGHLDMKAFESALGSSTHLVSLCMVQSETGAMQDLMAIRECMDRKSPRALLHTDAVQGLTKEALCWNAAKVDLISFSGHKFHALGGTGLLAVRPGTELKPLVFGGGQQGNVRSGSLDGIGILSLLIAATTLLEKREKNRGHVVDLNRRVREGVAALVPDAVFNSPIDGSPYILNASLPGYEGAVVMRMLDTFGVTIGTGSACSAGSGGPSQVLTAMGRDRKTAFGAIRISFGHTTHADEVECFLDALDATLKGY